MGKIKSTQHEGGIVRLLQKFGIFRNTPGDLQDMHIEMTNESNTNLMANVIGMY